MSIKKVKPTAKSKFKQGYFEPQNPDKYKGKMPIIYRSSWERKFMIMCDTREDILMWASEPVEIKYWSSIDKKEHRYYPDFWIKVRKQDESLDDVLVEIKPSDQLVKPVPPKKNSKKALKSYAFLAEQYVKNRDKYAYAKRWCEDRGWRFVVLTEKSLG